MVLWYLESQVGTGENKLSSRRLKKFPEDNYAVVFYFIFDIGSP